MVEGHTDSKPYPPNATYTNWELSADRANAARRLMRRSGIREDQITQVRGFADQRLRKSDLPLDPSNRRISLIVQYQQKLSDAASAPSEKARDTEGTNTPGNKLNISAAEGVTKPANGKAAGTAQQKQQDKN
ncbi:MAG: OmpA family protein [Candidatus Acidiferrum sp.]